MKKFLVSMLMCCMLLCFIGCSGATNEEIDLEEVVTVEDGQVIVDEEKLSEIMEEPEMEVWSDKVSDVLKPAFDAHPILQGEVIVGGTYEDMVAHIGEANVPSELEYLHDYSHTNSNGVELTTSFDYLEGADEYVRRMFYSEHKISNTPEYFMCDNEYYAITTETFDNVWKLKTDGVFYDTFKTYEDVVNVMGVPGYITYVEATSSNQIEKISIIWVIPPTDGDMEYIEFDFDATGKVS